MSQHVRGVLGYILTRIITFPAKFKFSLCPTAKT